jgi:hypothetical protein
MGEVRPQFSHVVDVMPTILDATGIVQPRTVDGVEQQHVDGSSLVNTFDSPFERSKHRIQYFEMLGNRGVYEDGWLANTTPKRTPWEFQMHTKEGADDYSWELYNLNDDYSQSRNLASLKPAKLKQLQAVWTREAKKNNVLPIDDRFQSRIGGNSKNIASKELTYMYWGRDISLPASMAPSFGGRSFNITADLLVPNKSADGVILATGGKFAGWSFFVKDGFPIAHEAYTQQPRDQFRITSTQRLKPGPAKVQFNFVYDGGGAAKGGTMHIFIDGKEVATGSVERTIVWTGATETFDIGRDTGDAVVDDYLNEGAFKGDIENVEVTVSALSSGSIFKN